MAFKANPGGEVAPRGAKPLAATVREELARRTGLPDDIRRTNKTAPVPVRAEPPSAEVFFRSETSGSANRKQKTYSGRPSSFQKKRTWNASQLGEF